MKLIRTAIVTTLVFVLAALMIPATTVNAAAVTTTVTLTEAQINASFRVSNPYRRSVSNLYVDLQQGQAVVSATVTLPNRTSYNTVSIFVPNIVNGFLHWTLVSATVKGKSLPSSVVTILNQAVYPNWRTVVSSILLHKVYGPYRINSAIVVSDTITIVASK